MNYVSTTILYSFLMASCAFCAAQSGKERKAAEDYQDFAFTDAISGYAQLVKDGYSDQDIYQRLGNANYYNARYEKAVEWYQKLFDLELETIEAEYMYRYAQSLKSVEKYEESDIWMQRFKVKTGNKDVRAIKYEENRDYLTDIKERSGNYKIKLAPFNSRVSDFAPSIYKEAIVFSSARDTGIFSKNIHEWDNGAFLDLYTSSVDANDSLLSTEKFSKNINRKTHESSTAFSKDGKTLYFTRNNSETGRSFSHDDKGISRLKLMKAELKDGEWVNVIELPFNAASHSVAHPTLNPEENRLYFSSDMEGTLGASDIFYVDIYEDGSYGEPINLGSEINTEARETFPFIAENNILYFASDGHPGLGGLDVFATDLNQKQRLTVVNLGAPVNSDEDDFSFVLGQDLVMGYFASNRDGGMGSDDIYAFQVTETLTFAKQYVLTGMVKALKTGEPISTAKVSITDTSNNFEQELTTDELGNFTTKIDGDIKSLKIIAGKESYLTAEKSFELFEGLEIVMLLDKETDALAYNTIDLPIIYFDFDKSNIRQGERKKLNKLVTLLNQWPELKLVIKSYTDSRGNNSYNMKLSQKRAQATNDYLVVKGINQNRLQTKHFGETVPRNDCINFVNCSEEEHQKNRRSEFEIIK